MDRNLKNVPGWQIKRYSYTRMATWEGNLVDAIIRVFNPDRSAELNFDPIKAVVVCFNKPEAYVSIRSCAQKIHPADRFMWSTAARIRQRIYAQAAERPGGDQKVITIWKGKRMLITLAETAQKLEQMSSEHLDCLSDTYLGEGDQFANFDTFWKNYLATDPKPCELIKLLQQVKEWGYSLDEITENAG